MPSPCTIIGHCQVAMPAGSGGMTCCLRVATVAALYTIVFCTVCEVNTNVFAWYRDNTDLVV